MATSEKDANRLLERLSGKALAEAEAVDGVLGFRGLVVSAQSDEQLPEGMSATFRIGGLLPADYAESALRALTGDESDDAVHWLLSTGQHAIKEDIFAYLEDTLEMRKQSFEIEPPTEKALEEKIWKEEAKLVAKAVCIIQNTAYNPGFWNAPAVIGKNNCYNYAMNSRSDTFAQPGRLSGHPNNIMACVNAPPQPIGMVARQPAQARTRTWPRLSGRGMITTGTESIQMAFGDINRAALRRVTLIVSAGLSTARH